MNDRSYAAARLKLGPRILAVLVLLILNLFSMILTQGSAISQEQPALTYFALGDSYASGHGLEGDGGESSACRQSPSSYPYLVRDALSESYEPIKFHHLACSGATATLNEDKSSPFKSLTDQFDVAKAYLNHRDGFTNPEPVLITITIGANDIGLTDWATRGQVSRQFNTAYGFFQWLDGKEIEVKSGLTPVIHGLLSHEDVYVVLTDYPNPFPEGLGSGYFCNDWVQSMSCEEALQNIVSRLNGIMVDEFLGVSHTKQLGVASLLGEPFSDHPVSGSMLDCIRGNSQPDNTWFQTDCAHPNQEGAQAIANAVVGRAMDLLPASKVTQAPTEAVVPGPTSSDQGFHLPWEPGSVWQITSDNDGGNHSDKYNEYAFDAVPVAGRSTPNVTAIADGTVLGFQSDVPNSARFGQGHAGNCMMIRHADGSISLYAHLAEGSIPGDLRHEGAAVRSGMVIGSVGDTGYASGVHLHWSLVSDGFMYDSEGYRTCAGTSIPSRYADNDAELIEDGGLPRAGRYYESTNTGAGATQAPPEPPAVACNDAGIPQISNGLAYSPQNPDTATEVTFSFTITNIGCGTFQPEVLAIGGRDPNSEVSDPLQIREFTLGPGESRNITQVTVLDMPGTHEFFMVFLRVNGGWNEIPDTSGVSQHIYINVTAATDSEAGPTGDSTMAPTISPSDDGTTNDSATSEGALTGETAPMDIGAYGPDGHAIGAQFTVTTTDGSFLGSCTLDGNSAEQHLVTCQVPVPRGTTVEVTLDQSTIPAGLVPVENPLMFDTSGDPGAASSWGVTFQLEPQGSNVGIGGISDVAIVTTENGQPVYDVCFVLVNFSNEGCDRNSDGKITFEDVPLGTYTLRQTADLGPGRAVQDSTIVVTGTVEGDGWERFPVSVGTGQSSGSGGASDVAIVTTENGQPVYDVCYVLVNFSNEGCDRNSDGKITFEDVPVGTYTLRQTANLGPGRSIPDTVVQVTGVTDADGWERIPVTVNGDDSTVPLAPSNTVTGAIMLITLRGCPETFNPSTSNFAAECTVPLDAPNNAFVDHGGEGQGGWFISQLDRQYDGTYVYTANPDTMNIKLRNLEPSVRDAFEVVGADFAEGDVYTINLDEGETRKIYVYYYYAQ